MTILVIFTGSNITKTMYEKLIKDLDWKHHHPPGLILHAAAFDNTENNIHVSDIWESEKELNDFVENKLKPLMKENNVPIPSVEVFQINNVSAFPGIEKYKI